MKRSKILSVVCNVLTMLLHSGACWTRLWSLVVMVSIHEFGGNPLHSMPPKSIYMLNKKAGKNNAKKTAFCPSSPSWVIDPSARVFEVFLIGNSQSVTYAKRQKKAIFTLVAQVTGPSYLA